MGHFTVGDVPGHVLAPRKKTPPIAGHEASRIGRVNTNETRAGRRAGHIPRGWLQIADGNRRTVQGDASDAIGPGHGRRMAHAPGCAAIEKRRQRNRRVIRLRNVRPHVGDRVIKGVCRQVGNVERRFNLGISPLRGNFDQGAAQKKRNNLHFQTVTHNHKTAILQLLPQLSLWPTAQVTSRSRTSPYRGASQFLAVFYQRIGRTGGRHEFFP